MKAILPLIAAAMIASSALSAAESTKEPKFCNIVFADTDRDIIGLQRFIDGAKARGIYNKIKFTVIMHSDKAVINDPQQKALYKELYKDGNEIGPWYADMRDSLASWLDIPKSNMTTNGFQLFGDPDVEEQAKATMAGSRASLNACVEGDSFKEEFWDIPHNWEGTSWLPYWVQWDSAKPKSTARVNRELHKSNAMLELQWATRTMWETYDRICLPQCFHFGEPLKKTQWPFSPLIKRGDIRWWEDEIDQLELNLKAKRTPFLYINTASEVNIFNPDGPWIDIPDSEEALDCVLDFIQMLIDKGWQLVTVSDFLNYYQTHYPCPSAPSAAFLMEDTLAGHKDNQGLIVPSHGRLLRIETKYFQITEHEKRMSPEMIVAYGLETPNLLRGGYTFGDTEAWRDGKNRAQYASTTGNAVFWSPTEPLKNANGEPYYHSNKPEDAFNRTYTFYLGDNWEPYQFTDASITNIKRVGEKIYWSKEMRSPIPGTDIRIRYDNLIDGPKHKIHITVMGNDAIGMPIRMRICPYFHQGWDNDYTDSGRTLDPRIPDSKKVGQERNVFARIGTDEFAYSDSNIIPHTRIVPIAEGPVEMLVFNRNPGMDPSTPGWTIDDNPDMNRGFTIYFHAYEGSYLEMIDAPGPSHYVTSIINLGQYNDGQTFDFAFEYWHGTK